MEWSFTVDGDVLIVLAVGVLPAVMLALMEWFLRAVAEQTAEQHGAVTQAVHVVDVPHARRVTEMNMWNMDTTVNSQ